MRLWFINQIDVLAGNQRSEAKKNKANADERRSKDLSYLHLRSSIWSLKSHRGRIPQAKSIMAQPMAPIKAPIGFGISNDAQYTTAPGSINTCRTENMGWPSRPWSPLRSGGPNL